MQFVPIAEQRCYDHHLRKRRHHHTTSTRTLFAASTSSRITSRSTSMRRSNAISPAASYDTACVDDASTSGLPLVGASGSSTATTSSTTTTVLPLLRSGLPRVKQRKRRRKATSTCTGSMYYLATTALSSNTFLLAFVCVGSVLFLLAAHRTLRLSSSRSMDHRHAPPHDEPGSVIYHYRRSLESSGTADTEKQFQIAPLRSPLDYRRFTVRINTWQREEQLQLSIAHHRGCAAVAQIQVVWCTAQGDVPAWLEALENEAEEQDDEEKEDEQVVRVATVVVERHAVNSLNERFNLLSEPPTAAVLSIDDDVLRPCLALDAAFMKWTRNPDRQLGFDARSHEIVTLENRDAAADAENNNNHNNVQTKWKYAYMSTTEKSNQYSTTLTRYSFLHRDYLRQYTTLLPQSVRDTVAEHFNCEDIAMSLWISARTGNRPPLLADFWAVKSQIKIYVPTKISGGHNHKGLRDDCMNEFADLLGLKRHNPHPLAPATLRHETLFDYGAPAHDWNRANSDAALSPALRESRSVIERWKAFDDSHDIIHELGMLRERASQQILEHGLLEKSQQWKDRFHPADEKKKTKKKVK